jgi:hypothetical protein
VLFLRIFQHLLPRGQAWRITITKTLRKFFEGLAVKPEQTKEFADQVYLDLFPATARSRDEVGGSGALEEWELQFGLTPGNLADFDARRAAVDAEWKAQGGQSPAYIESVLQAAGFDVYVHDWWSSGPPYVARDPHDYTTTPLLGTWRCSAFASQPRCSAFSDQPRCNAFLNNDPHYLVNKDLTRRAPPPIPDDPAKYPYFMYVGGATFGDLAAVDISRRDEFERLLLKLRPLHLWIVTLVNYTVFGGSYLTTESGLRFTTESGDRLTT